MSDNYNGRFDISWDGGGTNETRLSTWLGGTGNPTTVQGARAPGISGDNILCVTPKTYSFQNSPVPAHDVSWSVTPSNLFGSPTSGTGLNANLWAAGNPAGGEATLTYTFDHPACGERTFSRTIWVGPPAAPLIQAPQCFIPGSNVVLQAIAPGASNYTWTFPSCPHGIPQGDPISGCWFNYKGNGPTSGTILAHVGEQSGSISVFTSNACGTSSVNHPITFCGGGEPGGGVIIRSGIAQPDLPQNELGKILVLPNPSKGEFTLDFSALSIPVSSEKRLKLVNLTGKTILERSFMGDRLALNVTGIPPGIYLVRAEYLGGFAVQKVSIH